MSASKRDTENERFPEVIVNSFNAPERSNVKFIVDTNEKQHADKSTLALYSHNDQTQRRRSNKNPSTQHEGEFSTALSTPASTPAFHFLVDQMATDDLPAYVKQNTSALTFPEKVRDPNLLCFVCHL